MTKEELILAIGDTTEKMKVICINVGDNRDLTIGKTYQVEYKLNLLFGIKNDITGDHYCIYDDRDRKKYYSSDLLQTIEEHRDNKINNILGGK